MVSRHECRDQILNLGPVDLDHRPGGWEPDAASLMGQVQPFAHSGGRSALTFMHQIARVPGNGRSGGRKPPLGASPATLPGSGR